MTAAKTPAELSDAAAEAVRAQIHATLSKSSNGWQYPGDAYSVVANLAHMATMLPQALDQITQLINDLNESGHLRSDKDTLDDDLGEVFYGLDAARIAANQLYGALNRAHAGLGPIAYKD